MLDVPVLFLIFNRPEQTRVVFDAIKKAAPTKLFVAADGPRAQRPGELGLCQATRKVIDDDGSFKGEIHRLYRDANLGCAPAVTGAINWFFSNVEQGIILEDDCLPDPSFFSFCKQLLHHYKDDHRIMHISGNNFQLGKQRNEASYYFSRYPHIWGWATWKRAWDLYNPSMADYFSLKEEPEFKRYLDIPNLLLTYENKVNTWDSQWLCTLYRRKGYSILPSVNLVENIGFVSSQSTHTSSAPWWFKKIKNGSIDHIIHPKEIEYNNKADLFTHDYIFLSRRKRIKNRLQRFFKK